ncbi:polysaccharide export outer membrane protein [Sphingomonas jejuensis]|uniref:Polysaccharide export outer membrane protein n=1 Tax=Sphingomonas jejuensis TaxID=904715 RepID=A0ABX0XLX7_9SPHN|nr:polysaccharide export outer membrane protein [Sphingomonas jejuensis]
MPISAAALAQSTPAPQPAGSPAPQYPAYRINPGDQLEVYVWGEERLSREIRVLPDGTFSFPLVGRVQAAGQLPADIERQISVGLTEQYRGQVPQVTVSVTAPAGFQVSVAGKVRTPGSIQPGRYINVLEAVIQAGGPTEFADTSNVTILRKQGAGIERIRVRLSDALRGSPNDRDREGGLPQLLSGDTVVVP